MNRDIGIMTFHRAENYGAILQCYALQEALRRLCPHDEVCVVDYRCPAIERAYKVIMLRKTARATVMQFFYVPARLRTKKAFAGFRSRFLNMGSADFSECGLIVYGCDETYLGAGYEGNKVSYAASSGGELEATQRVKELLSAFTAISCREESLAQLLRRALQTDAVRAVCDPVFLLQKSEWLKLAKRPREDGFVLVYYGNPYLMEETKAFAARFAKKVGEIVFVRGLRTYLKKEHDYAAGITPEEFVGYFAGTDFVCTASFHGTAFSILLEKGFYAFEIKRSASRITDLLSLLGISERYVASIPERESLEAHAINWEGVRPRLEAYRAESLQFIEESIANSAVIARGGAQHSYRRLAFSDYAARQRLLRECA